MLALSRVVTGMQYTALLNSSQYPAGFPRYTPSLYRVERPSPIKLVGLGGADGCRRTQSGKEQKCRGAVPCGDFPTSEADLQSGHFPREDWAELLHSLWQPWHGYIYQGAVQLLEANDPAQEAIATTSPGAVYMRGHGAPAHAQPPQGS